MLSGYIKKDIINILIKRGFSENNINYILDAIDKSDTSPKKSYVLYIAKNIDPYNFEENLTQLSELTATYHTFKERKILLPEHKEILKFNLQQLYELIQIYVGVKSKRGKYKSKEEEGVKIVLEYGNDSGVVEITTPEAAAWMCRNTGWCVKDPAYSIGYLRHGPLYLYADKNFRFLMYFDKDDYQITDEEDSPLSTKVFNNYLQVIIDTINIRFKETKVTIYDIHKNIIFECDCYYKDIAFKLMFINNIYLSAANLHDFNLSNIDLLELDFSNANMSGVNLKGSVLNRSIFHKTNLRYANLESAFFVNSDLSRVDLREANIRYTCFIGADLRGADLRGVNYNKKTDFNNTKLDKDTLIDDDYLMNYILNNFNIIWS